MTNLENMNDVENRTSTDVSLDETKQGITEIIVKPSTCWNLEIISMGISDWLYKILNAENEFCKVDKSELRLGIYGLSEEIVNWVADIQWDPSVQFAEQRVNNWYWGKVEKREVSWVSRIVFWKDFWTYKLIDMDWIIDIYGLNNWYIWLKIPD